MHVDTAQERIYVTGPRIVGFLDMARKCLFVTSTVIKNMAADAQSHSFLRASSLAWKVKDTLSPVAPDEALVVCS